MGNTNVQGVVPLMGKGFTVKLKNNYKPGEYSYLVNAEITSEGILQQRRNIQAIGDGDADRETLTNPYPIAGFFQNYAVLATDTKHFAMEEDTVVPLWDISNLTVPATAGSMHRIIAAFVYNDTYYWLTLQYDAAGLGIYTYYLLQHDYDPFTGVAGIAWAGVTQTALFTSNFWSPMTQPHNVFIHKDRLWIITPGRIYYSKATDPTIFAVPDGGFFDIPDESINGGAAIGDSIYFVCSNGVYSVTYATDVATDGYLRKLANIGGDSICIHKSTPYFVGRNGEVYRASGMSVDKVHDGRVENPYPQGDNFKITSFEEYLIILRRNFAYYTASTNTTNHRSFKFTPDTSGFDSIRNLNCFWINTDNGSTHAIDFTDANDEADEVDRGYIIDVAYNPAKGYITNRKLFLLTNRVVDPLTYSHKGNVYRMNPHKGWFVVDEAYDSTDTKQIYRQRIHIEWDNLTLDGNEYLGKKFRNLLMMGKFPYTDFEVAVCYDNQDFDTANHKHQVSHTNLTEGDERLHHPIRLPLNQRGRAINIRLQTLNGLTPITASTIWDQFELSDMRILWSPTQRLPEERLMPTDLTP